MPDVLSADVLSADVLSADVLMKAWVEAQPEAAALLLHGKRPAKADAGRKESDRAWGPAAQGGPESECHAARLEARSVVLYAV